MSIFKSIKFELLILALITLSIFVFFNLDLFFYNYFINFSEWLNGVFLKEFFSEITNEESKFPSIDLDSCLGS